MKKKFIDKWSSWWITRNDGKELTDAFEKELDEIIQAEAKKPHQKVNLPDVSVCDKNNEHYMDIECIGYCQKCGNVDELKQNEH